ncbi:MAG TPA: cation transporter [Acetobacteraceae bacterium]|nr:cation transporter [Acetobacteraceae bacterium]
MLRQRGLALEYATLGWNVVGFGVMAITAWRAGSIALAGFGLDSLIEIFASVVVIWQLMDNTKGREPLALRLIGGAFFLLAVYLPVQAAVAWSRGARPAPSQAGMIWLLATVVAMLLLAWGKLSVGRALGNAVLIAESRVTLIDAALAMAVLLGIGLNALFGWWWSDPLAGLVIVIYAIAEGRAAWRVHRGVGC